MPCLVESLESLTLVFPAESFTSTSPMSFVSTLAVSLEVPAASDKSSWPLLLVLESLALSTPAESLTMNSPASLPSALPTIIGFTKSPAAYVSHALPSPALVIAVRGAVGSRVPPTVISLVVTFPLSVTSCRVIELTASPESK